MIGAQSVHPASYLHISKHDRSVLTDAGNANSCWVANLYTPGQLGLSNPILDNQVCPLNKIVFFKSPLPIRNTQALKLRISNILNYNIGDR
jgi:hypothetical protein